MPKVVDHDARRAHLLRQCFQLMAEDGYSASSMRRIAKAAGVSTGALYHYFPDKPAILVAMFELLIERDQARVTANLSDDAPVEDRIRTLYRFLREERAYLQSLLRLALEVHRHEPGEDSRARVQDAVRGYREAMGEVLGLDGQVVTLAFHFVVGSLAHGLLDPEAEDLDAEEALVLSVWRELLDR